MLNAKSILGAASAYLRNNPAELVRATKNAFGLKFGLPIAALEWLGQQLKGKSAPTDIEIGAEPPGLRLAASFNLMGTLLRGGAVVTVQKVRWTAEELRVDIRLTRVSLEVLDDSSESPIVALLKSGALDLSKPGNLAAYMPKRPEALVDAEDDRVAIDFMKLPAVAQNAKLRRLLGIGAQLIAVDGIATDWEHLDVALKAFPQGVGAAVGSIREYL